MITVTVIYAQPQQQYKVVLTMPETATIAMCIEASGLMQQCPEIDLSVNKVGVYSTLADLSQQVKQGDRVEIYRPLLVDPKEKRRQRANRASTLQR